MVSSVVFLEKGHVPCCADHEESHEDSGDGDIDAFLGCAAERPCCGEIRTAMFLLRGVRIVKSCEVCYHTICEDMIDLSRSESDYCFYLGYDECFVGIRYRSDSHDLSMFILKGEI